MNDITKNYDSDFYDYTISAESGSSHDVARIIIDTYSPRSVIDIGCGCGIYLKAFMDLGIDDVTGYDGSQYAVDKALVPDRIILHDLRNPLVTGRKYDICLCIEVAEHIEKKYSWSLVNALTDTSDIVFFTAACPGQGGLHHINEQPYEFWESLFRARGFEKDSMAEIIREEFSKAGVVQWITKNMVVFKRL